MADHYGFGATQNKQMMDHKRLNNFYRHCLDDTREAMTKPTGKTEITLEMIQRAYDAVPDRLLFRSTVQAMLDAALNPPSEPEIVVTDEMSYVGQKWLIDIVARGQVGEGDLWVAARNIYRAMRKLEPKA